jgi:hypothetical protein
VTFIDSQSLGLLIGLLRAAQSRGGETVLVQVGERAAKWFELSGLDQIFRMLPDEAALARPRRPAAGPERPKPALEQVNIERMVEELQAALGQADAAGAPSAVGPIDERALSEIEKLLSGS